MAKPMTILRSILIAASCLSASHCLSGAEGDSPEPTLYRGEQVTGDRVLAIWQFQPGAELQDAKGEADLRLTGQARVVPDQTFGGALECFATLPDADKPNGATAPGVQSPTPDGAFTLEAWVKLKAEPRTADWTTGYIIDKTYVPRTHEDPRYNKDYYLNIRKRTGSDSIVLQAGVGLGDEVITFASAPVPYAAGVWRHMAFAYNGKGTGMLFLDGTLVGKKTYPDKGPAAAGSRGLTIGERSGSRYNGLPGYLAQVRIAQGLPTMVNWLDIAVAHPFQRAAFERMEEDQIVEITLTNLGEDPITDVTLSVSDGIVSRNLPVGDLDDEPRKLSVPLSCAGKAGGYTLTVNASARMQGDPITGKGTYTYALCNRLPDFMPVVMWGGANFDRMEQIGFTHSLHWMDHLDMQAWQAGEPIGFHPRFDEVRETLDEALVRGLRVMGKMSPGGYFKSQKAYEEARQPYLCHDRNGNPTKAVNFSLPRVQQFGYDAGRSIANNVGMFPAVDMVLADSEFRDSSQVSFREEDRAAFRKAAGMDIPEQITAKTGIKYERLDSFPHDRIIPDDDPILTFYQWLWGGGDGYAGFLTQDWRGLTPAESHIRVLWDPVVRCASKWGSGGQVDLVGHWTYVYPDPLVMGLAADEVFAMAKGGPPHQQPTKMTQIIWYREQTTGPLPENKDEWADWEKERPEARFITIPPDMLEIALWQKLSRPVRAIMYHGAGSLWPSDPGGYDFTNPDTAPRLASLVSTVVKPFGPMLREVPDRPAKVAMLESFASQMYYGGATYGTMRGPVGRMHGVLTRAHLQPEIIYDETILRDGLDSFEVLVMPACPVLTESVARAIETWQAEGGIIVADETLAPRLMPDILIRQVQSNAKDESVAKAEQLRNELGDAYLPYAEADTADAILRTRVAGTTDYLFVLNDKRTYGNYVGQYRRVMEKGLPSSATVTIRRPRGTVYDLLATREAKTTVQDGTVRLPVQLGPGEGRLFMITERPIGGVTIDGAAETERSDSVTWTITVVDDTGRALDAAVPMRVDITDPQGNPAEFSGWHAAVDGKLALKLDVAPNDAAGRWMINAQEMASGKTTQKTFVVK